MTTISVFWVEKNDETDAEYFPSLGEAERAAISRSLTGNGVIINVEEHIVYTDAAAVSRLLNYEGGYVQKTIPRGHAEGSTFNKSGEI